MSLQNNPNWGTTLVISTIVLGSLFGLSIIALPLWVLGVLFAPLIFGILLVWPKTEEFNSVPLLSLFIAYLVVFSIWPQYSAYKIPGLPAIEPQRILFGLVLVSVIFSLFTSIGARTNFIRALKFGRLETITICSLFVCHFLSAIWGQTPGLSLFLIFKEFIVTASVFFMCLVIVRNEQNIDYCLRALMLSGLIVSLLALLESVIKHNLFSSWVPLTTDYAVWAVAERVRGGAYRVQATFDNPLLLVDYLIFVLPVSLYCAFNVRTNIWRIIGFISLVTIPLALLRTGSRSAILALSIQIGFIICLTLIRRIRFSNRSYLSVLILGGGGFMSIIVLIFSKELSSIILGRNTEELMSTSVRLTMLTRSINYIFDGHVFGFGFGNAAKSIGIRTGPPGGWIYVLDNYFLTLLLDSGVMAVFLYVIAVLAASLKSVAVTLNHRGATGAIGATLLVSISGFFFVKFISSQTQIFPLFYAFLAFSIVLLRDVRSRLCL